MGGYSLSLPSRLKAEAEELAARLGISLDQFILSSVAEKVGSLWDSLDDPAFAQVIYRRGTVGQPVPVLRGTGIARVVRGPIDRGAGALLGGAKAALVAWALLSVLALAGDLAPDALRARARDSDLAALARAHNLVARLDPDAARRLEKRR